MAILSHSFPLPSFEKLPDEDIKVFQEVLADCGDDKNIGDLVVRAVAPRLSDETRSFYQAAQTFYEVLSPGSHDFRPLGWHLDG